MKKSCSFNDSKWRRMALSCSKKTMAIAKPCTQLHPAPLSSTQLLPPPPSSIQPPLSSLQHLLYLKNQNIAHNWAISPNLGRKIQVY